MSSYISWKTNNAQFRTRVTRHQHSGDETALQHHPRAGRSQSVDGRQVVQCWIGHEPATNFCETEPSHHEDCRERIRSCKEVNHVTEQIETPQIQWAEKRDSPTTACRHDHVHKVQRALKFCGATQHNTFHSLNGAIRTWCRVHRCKDSCR